MKYLFHSNPSEKKKKSLAGTNTFLSAQGPEHFQGAGSTLTCRYCNAWQCGDHNPFPLPTSSSEFGLHYLFCLYPQVIFPVQSCLSSPPELQLQGSQAQNIIPRCSWNIKTSFVFRKTGTSTVCSCSVPRKLFGAGVRTIALQLPNVKLLSTAEHKNSIKK